jgi:Restriction endonuclease NotI
MVSRYGAGELYGFDVSTLPAERIRELALAKHKEMPCPFKLHETGKPQPKCSKKGGVCSLRQYVEDACVVTAIGKPVTTCPHRFLERKLIFEWVGEALLGSQTPTVISELPFLMNSMASEEEEAGAVGKIDKVLVNAEGQNLKWCALEMQAVYFSGKSMENDFVQMRTWTGPGLPFPQVQRRPDFRSSGPKRLMPQLQIKVPTISRWGKKMAVVVDKAFWESLSEMREVRDLSNAEIAWFVVSFSDSVDGRFSLQRSEVHYTTLGHAVEGLTGGTPMSLENFESEIRERMMQL